MITQADFRRMALACAGVVERSHMGHPDFRAFDRIFASIQNGERGALKLTPEEQARFVGGSPQAFVSESGAWGRQGWTRVIFAAAEEEAVGDALTLAWQSNALAATKRAASKRAPAKRVPTKRAPAKRVKRAPTKRKARPAPARSSARTATPRREAASARRRRSKK